MNRAEALETLKEMAFTAYGHRSEALDMAISALSDYDIMQKISLDLAFENDELLNELDSIKNGTPLSADGDCISRQAVLDELEKWGQELYLPIHFKENIIDVLPSVQPKKGEWIAHDIHNCCTEFKCSKCGYTHVFTHLYGKPTADYTYCPNCGADMRGKADEDNH